jgi:hypothetical protein
MTTEKLGASFLNNKDEDNKIWEIINQLVTMVAEKSRLKFFFLKNLSKTKTLLNTLKSIINLLMTLKKQKTNKQIN